MAESNRPRVGKGQQEGGGQGGPVDGGPGGRDGMAGEREGGQGSQAIPGGGQDESGQSGSGADAEQDAPR